MSRGASSIALAACTSLCLLAASTAAQPVDCTLRQAFGFTEPALKVDVAAREPGIVAHVLVEPGDRVKAGDVLAELDKTLTLAEVESARAQSTSDGRLAVARARSSQAERRLEELSKLEKARAVRPLEIVTAKADVETASAELQAAMDERHVAELALVTVQARLALLDVRAPFDGIVDEIHHQEAELVGAGGDARMVTLVKLDVLHSDVFVPAGCVGAVQKGAEVDVELARLGRHLVAHIRDLGVEIDAPTGLRRVGLAIDNPDYAMLGGERLVVALPIAGLER